MLLWTLVTLMTVAVLSLAVIAASVNSLKFTKRTMYSAQAFDIAETGAGAGMLWLQQQTIPPAGLTTITPFNGAQTVTGGSYSGTYNVSIYPDAGNNTNYLKTYRIVSTGIVQGVTVKVEVVWRQGSFGGYAYFTDSETSGGSTIWWKAGEVCDGPAHSNNAGGSNFHINYTGSVAPIFTNLLTASGSSIVYSPSTPTTQAQFNNIYLNGGLGYEISTPVISLPASTTAQQVAAWGSTTGFPATTGVYLKAASSGGLYIVGDAGITMSRGTTGQQIFTIKQGSNTTTVTVDLHGTVSTSGPMGTGSPTSATVIPNGVLYCTGNVTSLSGVVTDNLYANNKITVPSSWTIATDVNNGKGITVSNNITYNTQPNKALPATDVSNLAAGTLGLYANNVTIPTTAPANLTIDAVCMAGGSNTATGSFSVTSYDTRTPVGTLSLLGGLIQKQRGAVGTFNSGTGLTQTGYNKSYHYDPRLAANPPPFYPTTGTYTKLSWRVTP